MDELAPGEVLEILSLEPSAPVEIVMWCRVMGHKLIRLQEDGEKTHFWIRKC